jgi:molybdopterin synthase sulfur carrier subunit
LIRVILPPQLRSLAGAERMVELDVGAPTQRALLDALEARYPTLGGTIRDRQTQRRRPLVRFYACEEDISDEEPDAELPEEVASGKEPFLIIGAMSGGATTGGQPGRT